jgi:hypothetical protein
LIQWLKTRLYGEKLVSLQHHRLGWPIIKLKDKLYGISCCILWAYIILNENPIVKTETHNRREKKSQSQLPCFPLSFDITPELSVGVGVISHLLEVSILKQRYAPIWLPLSPQRGEVAGRCYLVLPYRSSGTSPRSLPSLCKSQTITYNIHSCSSTKWVTNLVVYSKKL